jgi:hypothetical protein
MTAAGESSLLRPIDAFFGDIRAGRAQIPVEEIGFVSLTNILT